MKKTEALHYAWHKIYYNSEISYFALKTDYVQRRIGIELFIPESKELFTYLEEDKDKIEEEIESKLIWQNDKRQRFSKIMLFTYKFNPRHGELWNYSIKWHLDFLNKFYKTFYPRIKEFENNMN